MPGPKTNEREGTRAVLHHVRVSPYKLREVIDAIRGKPVHEAADLLRFVERDAAVIVEKLLNSAVANASNNDGLDPEELFVSACYVDEGPTAKRWRPRARGRAARIRKRSSHVTVIVSRLPEERLARLQARRRAENLAMRARRVEATRRARSETTEGVSRRERRHPEALAAPEPGTTGAEEEDAAAAETPEAVSAEVEAPSSEAAAPTAEAEAAETEAAETEMAPVFDDLSASADETSTNADETSKTVHAAPQAQEAPQAEDAPEEQDAIHGEEEKGS
jgi:large subunit ribosomal protein L22